MTDNEIIKLLECCAKSQCSKCYYSKECDGYTQVNYALDLVNRQQAEIERLNKEIQIGKDAYTMIQTKVAIIKIETIKEFVKSLNDRIINFPSVYPIENATLAFLNGSSHRQLEILEIINNLVKEYEKGR